MPEPKLPTFDDLINPLLRALKDLGGSGTVEEIYSKIVELLQLPEAVLTQLHDPDRSTQTEVGYRLAWARTYLKKYGIVENSARGVWALTDRGSSTEHVNSTDVVRAVRAMDRNQADSPSTTTESDKTAEELNREEDWKAACSRR